MNKTQKCLYCGGDQVRREWRAYWNGNVALSGFAFRVVICVSCGNDTSARLREHNGAVVDDKPPQS